MIILTKVQADLVRGVDTPGYALDPVVLANGKDWVLPEAVLADPAHAKRREYLASLPSRAVDPSEYPQGED